MPSGKIPERKSNKRPAYNELEGIKKIRGIHCSRIFCFLLRREQNIRQRRDLVTAAQRAGAKPVRPRPQSVFLRQSVVENSNLK
jgi:hypothetical protein